MKSAIIHPSQLAGKVTAPPSKSHTLRALLFASLAEGESAIHHYLPSPDVEAMAVACEQWGATVRKEGRTLFVRGVAGEPTLPNDVINAGNSGQVLRFAAAIAALTNGYTVLTGDHSVRYNRPIKPLMDGLEGLGASCFSTKGDDHAPLIVKGPIIPGHTALLGDDSQPVSAILMAAAFLKGTSTVEVSDPGETPWVALTLDWFGRLGIEYTNDNFEHYTIKGNARIKGFNYTVPGDFSSMAYPLVAALITGASLTIDNADMADIQGDKKVIEILQNMGAHITASNKQLHVKPSGTLKGRDIDINHCIDALPILAVAACYSTGTTRLLNAAIARKKESDRLAAITMELRKMGAHIEESESSLTIKGNGLQGAVLESHYDHRIALSLAVAALGASGSSTIHHVECIDKSYSDFFSAMGSLGAKIEVSQ